VSGSNGQRLLTAEELAERWQVAKAHVYRLAREGRIPTVAIGRYYRFRLSSIEAWEAEQERAAE
jgi:excisionase family DNA binding protein